MDKFMRAAIEEAKKGLREGGIPIGSVLVKGGKIIGRGHKCKDLMREFIKKDPRLWDEDIGE